MRLLPISIRRHHLSEIIMNPTLKKLIRPIYHFAKSKVLTVRSRRKIRALIAERKILQIEVGAGNKGGSNDWITIDMTPKCDIFWDLRNGIPFPDESVSKIYSSHFFEHLTYKESQIFLDDCLRVLKSGGVFSICVPNARLYIDAYLNNKKLGDDHWGYIPAINNTTKIDYVNYMAYMDGHHKYMFDKDNLVHILNSKCFKNVRLREFDPSLDMQERDFESIYAEGQK